MFDEAALVTRPLSTTTFYALTLESECFTSLLTMFGLPGIPPSVFGGCTELELLVDEVVTAET
jgi:hypothetical protein